MLIFYSIKTRVYEEIFLEHEPDPMGEGTGVGLRSQRKYMTLAALPFLPLIGMGKVVEAYSPGSAQSIPVLLWSESMMDAADQLLARAGSWWRYGFFMPLFFTVLAALALMGITSANTYRNLEQQQPAYLADPQVGDVVIACDRKNPEDYNNEFRVAYRIVRVDAEYIYARRSSETRPGGWKRLDERPKIAKTFTLSESIFTGPEERFSRAMYNHRSRAYTLQDVSVPHDQRGYGMSVDLVLRPGER